MNKQGFALIELLIVVAIISILSAIAIPNFLEAQTRAKVAKVKGDHRTISIALESYATDANSYPFMGEYGMPFAIHLGCICMSHIPYIFTKPSELAYSLSFTSFA